jgi:hypothetical protein
VALSRSGEAKVAGTRSGIDKGLRQSTGRDT